MRAFLKVIKVYPPAKIPNHLEERLHRDGKATHDYPPEMGLVLEGMELFYPRDVEVEQVQPKVRTKYTLFSARNERNPRGYNQPVFASSYVGYEKWADPVAACIPAPDRELDWLESFLHICDYMGSMQVEMKSG